MGLIGVHGANFPINFVHLWNSGPEEGVLQVQLKPGASVSVEKLQETLRQKFAAEIPETTFSFEPADIVNRVMSLGTATPIEVAVSGQDLPVTRAFAERVKAKLEQIDTLRDVQFGQLLDYPTVEVNVDRERAGIIGANISQVSKALVPATWSSRFTVLNFWADPGSGVAYQVQVQIPQRLMASPEDVGNLPIVQHKPEDPAKDKVKEVLLRNLSQITEGTALGEYDRYNMQRMISVRANIAGDDLGGAIRKVNRAIAELGAPPRGVNVDLRGQALPMQEMLGGLRRGLLLAVLAIFLLLMANFQSPRLSLIVVSTIPAVLAGVVLSLWLTKTTLNIQSFMGAIMGVGVAVANAILLVTFAERSRLSGATSAEAAVEGARTRLRPILMTSAAMIAGMLSMACKIGQGGGQAAPLGRAVVGGLAAATVATLFVLPLIFSCKPEAFAAERRWIPTTTTAVTLNPEKNHGSFMNTKTENGMFLLILAATIACFCGCDQKSAAPAKAEEEPPLSVKTVHPHRGEICRYINLPGEVHPLFQVTLFAKVDGYLKTLTVDKGDSVKAGDLIADIEVPELQANKIKYQAEVELAEAEFKQISESPTNNPVGGSTTEIEEAKNKVAVARGRLAVAKANLNYTESMLNYARITAPFDGIITKRFVDPGAYIPVPNAADTPQAAAIVDVTDFKTLRMQVAVPEIESPHIALGQSVRWTTDALPGQNFDGAVTRTYWALDRLTKTMLTEVQLTNRDMALRPGMLVNARIALEKKDDAIVVPVAILLKERANSYVFIVADNKAKQQPVKTGFNDGTNVEIVSGVGLDDLVILTIQPSPRDGQSVKATATK